MKEKELEQMDKEELLGIIKAQRFEIERLNNIIKEIRNNWNDLTEDKVYLKMSKEILVKTVDMKRDTISYIRIERDKLQERIDKAIEYIETVNTNENDTLHIMFLTENYISNYGAVELLDILEGSDKE